MTNYPKEWIEALANNISMTWLFEKPQTGFQLHGDKVRHIASGILSVLDKVGALKEIPKPREFWIHTHGLDKLNSQDVAQADISRERRGPLQIKVREVLEDE